MTPGPSQAGVTGAWVVALSGIFGALAISLSAVGAHVLRERLSVADFDIYSSAVQLLLVHAAVLFTCGVALARPGRNLALKVACLLFVAGILLFCGGLIGRVVFGMPVLGRAAPTGGSAFIAGWLAIGVAGINNILDKR